MRGIAHYLERAVLADCMTSAKSRLFYLENLKPEHFEVPRHRMVFEAIMSAIPVDEEGGIAEVSLHMIENGTLAGIGGAIELSKILDEPVPVNKHKTAEKLESLRRIRDVIRTCEEVSRDCQASDLDSVSTVLETAEARLSGAIASQARSARRTMADVMRDVKEDYARAKKGETRLIYSGLRSVDRMIGGFRGGDVVIIAGRPSMGKTAFAVNMATGMAKQGTACAFFSLEQADRQLAVRMLAAETGINSLLVRHGKLNDYEEMLFEDWSERISRWPIHTCDLGGMTLPEIAQRAKQYHRDENIQAIFIDYLQIIRPDRKHSSQNEFVSYLSGGIKALAKQLDVPVFCLSQLNRALANRADKKPQMSDLRDSGAIEQDADIIMFPHREWVYNKENDALRNQAELIIAKYRDGQTGSVFLRWEESRTRFFDIEKHHQEA